MIISSATFYSLHCHFSLIFARYFYPSLQVDGHGDADNQRNTSHDRWKPSEIAVGARTTIIAIVVVGLGLRRAVGAPVNIARRRALAHAIGC